MLGDLLHHMIIAIQKLKVGQTAEPMACMDGSYNFCGKIMLVRREFLKDLVCC